MDVLTARWPLCEDKVLDWSETERGTLPGIGVTLTNEPETHLHEDPGVGQLIQSICSKTVVKVKVKVRCE